MNDLSKIRRYELKYTITESMAAEIRDYISNICTLDEHVPPGETGYIVNSLYFDTPDLRFYTDTKFRKMTRYKLRSRFYGEKISDTIWPEIKYRHASIIWKIRYQLPVDKWYELLDPEQQRPLKSEIKSRIDRFEDLIYWYNASSVSHVRYFREPYVTTLENYGRITFDRQLSYRSLDGSVDLNFDEGDMIYYDDPVTTISAQSFVLLEIKVETLVPLWVTKMIKKFNLMQRPFSKYCYSIDNYHHNVPSDRISVIS